MIYVTVLLVLALAAILMLLIGSHVRDGALVFGALIVIIALVGTSIAVGTQLERLKDPQDIVDQIVESILAAPAEIS